MKKCIILKAHPKWYQEYVDIIENSFFKHMSHNLGLKWSIHLQNQFLITYMSFMLSNLKLTIYW